MDVNVAIQGKLKVFNLNEPLKYFLSKQSNQTFFTVVQ